MLLRIIIYSLKILLQLVLSSFVDIIIINSSKDDKIALVLNIIAVILKLNITKKTGAINSNNPVNLFA